MIYYVHMTLDIVLLLIIALVAMRGFWKGIIMMVVSLVAMIAAFYAALVFGDSAATYLGQFVTWTPQVISMVSSVILFVLVSNGLYWMGVLLMKTWRILPFGATIDRILGAVLGAAEGILLAGFVMRVIAVSGVNEQWSVAISSSGVAVLCISVTNVLLPMLAGQFETLKALYTK